MNKIWAVFFADEKLPSRRLMTSLGMYFDYITIPLAQLEEGSYLEQTITRFPRGEREFLANNAAFLDYFGNLSPSLFRFPNTLQPFTNQTKAEKNLAPSLEIIANTLPSEAPVFLLPMEQKAWTLGFYEGLMDSAAREEAPLVIPLSERDPFGIPIYSAKKNKRLADVLASWLAVESIQLSLPDLEAVHPSEILRARENLAAELLAFRTAMYYLAKELRNLVQESNSSEVLSAEAAFIAKTTVVPAVEALRERIRRERRSLSRRIVVRALDTFKVIGTYCLAPNPMNAAQLASEAAKGMIKFSEYCDQLAKMENERAISYLARLPSQFPRKSKKN